jgi:hypothetical protein
MEIYLLEGFLAVKLADKSSSWLYRCALHRYEKTATKISSGSVLKPVIGWDELIYNYRPLTLEVSTSDFENGTVDLVRNYGVQITHLDPNNVDVQSRKDILNSTPDDKSTTPNQTLVQLRYMRWQLYYIAGEQVEKGFTPYVLPGLWERVPLFECNQPDWFHDHQDPHPPAMGP